MNFNETQLYLEPSTYNTTKYDTKRLKKPVPPPLLKYLSEEGMSTITKQTSGTIDNSNINRSKIWPEVQWMAVKIFILEKRLKEHTDKMEQMERMMDPKATMDSLDKSAANIRSLEKSVASAAEISVSVNPLLDSLARMEKRIVELENRPQPQQSCCVVS